MVGVVRIFAEVVRACRSVSQRACSFMSNCKVMANMPGKIEEYVDSFLAEVCNITTITKNFVHALK